MLYEDYLMFINSVIYAKKKHLRKDNFLSVCILYVLW